jgi:hypothetical protein
MVNVQKYTQEKLAEQIVAAELHLTDYIKIANSKGNQSCVRCLALGECKECGTDTSSDFCIDCLGKHSLSIRVLSEEGTMFCNNEPIYTWIYDIGSKLYNALPYFNLEEAIKNGSEEQVKRELELANLFRNALRNARKRIVRRHIISPINAPPLKLGDKPDHTHLE